jgi:hypothetical protein
MTGTLAVSSPNVGSLVTVGAPPFSIVNYLPFVGQPVAGTGIPAGTTVLAVTDPADIVLSQNATAGGSQVLTFGVEPVTLAEALQHCKIEFPDDDTLVSTLITAARRYCETRLRSALITQTWVLYLDGFPAGNASYYNKSVRPIWAAQGAIAGANAFGAGVIPSAAGVIDIPLPPLQNVVSIQYLDFNSVLQTLSSSVYNVSRGVPGRIQPLYSQFWPINPPIIDSVQVTFQCGYGPLESNVPANVQTAIKYMVGTWYEHRESITPGVVMPVPDTVDALLSIDDPGIYA